MMEIPASNAKHNRHSANSAKSNTLRSKRGYGAGGGQHLRTAYLVKTASGFGFTLADTESGQVVRLTADQLGRNQLKSGDVIVAIGDTDVSRETHLNVVSMLKSYPSGSTARIGFIRPADGSRVRRRARSTVPDAQYHGSVHSASSSVKAAFPQRPTSRNPETVGREAAANGWTGDRAAPMEPKPPRTPGVVLPRSSSLSYSSEASKTQPVKVEEGKRTDGLHQQPVDFRAPGEDPIALRKTLPAYEIQRQYWMSLSPTNSNLNFSGTPDYIPASVYSLSSTSGRKTNFLSSSSIEARPLDNPSRITNKLSELNFRTDSALTDEYSRMSGVEGNRTNSFSSESKAHSVKTRLFQREAGSKRQQMKVGSTRRRSSRNHQTSINSGYENSATAVDQATTSATGNRTLVYGNIDHDKGTLSPVDRQSPVYSLEIHRGSRGFGFSIRGGKEFRGMPLLVLNIAKGGPADTDGRMKNGDQILSINGFETNDMTHKRAIELIQSATSPISLTMKRTTDTGASAR